MRAHNLMVVLILVAGLLSLGTAQPARAADVDGDGVDDALDVCCDTPTGAAVDAEGRPLGDIDKDCDTDLTDYGLFQQGFTGVGSPQEDRSCNPVAQTGCDPCEKCAFVRQAENPDEWRTFCRPNGSVQSGGACAIDPTTDVDDCAAGLFCAGGTCSEICSVAPDSCPSGGRCTELLGVVDTQNVGYCQVSCDPLSSPSTCSPGEACFIDVPRETTLCVPPDETGTQGVACEYLNSCASGYSCALIDPPDIPAGLVCAFICDALEGGGPTCTEGPGPSFTCVQINRFYSDVPGLPDAYGMCIDPQDWDEDGDSVLDFDDQCPGTQPGTPVDAFGCPT